MKNLSSNVSNKTRGRKPIPLKLIDKDGVRPEVSHLEEGHVFTGGMAQISELLGVPYHSVYNAIKKDGTFHGLKLTKNLKKQHVTINNTSINLTINNNKVEEPKEFGINQKFQFIGHMVSMIINGDSNALIISGSGGLGKTHEVMSGFNKEGKIEGEDYMTIKGYSTPKALYRELYNAMQVNKKMVVVFDDCDSILENDTAINILKATLDSYEVRKVSWMASSVSDDMPQSFDFTGRIIFISNRTLKSIDQAILSRALFVDVTMTSEEKIDRISGIIKDLSPTGKKDVDMQPKLEVLALLKEHKDVIADLNIRTFLKVLEVRLSGSPNWKHIALYLLTTKV